MIGVAARRPMVGMRPCLGLMRSHGPAYYRPLPYDNYQQLGDYALVFDVQQTNLDLMRRVASHLQYAHMRGYEKKLSPRPLYDDANLQRLAALVNRSCFLLYSICWYNDETRGRRIMANMPAFQASDESSILSARTKVKTGPCDRFLLWSRFRIKLWFLQNKRSSSNNAK